MKVTMLFLMTAMAVVSAIGCGNNTTTVATSDIISETDATIPELSEPDRLFYDGEAYDLTYGELYEEIKINDGLSQLLNMIDSDLLEDWITEVTVAEMTDMQNYLTYGTKDPEQIAALDPEDKTDYEEAYLQNLTLAGYKDNEEAYLRLVTAKENYARVAMTDPDNSEESWYVGPQTIADYYMESHREDLVSLKIRFMSETEAKDVMKSLNLVGKMGNLYRYTGTKPIDEVPSSGFDETNTELLTGNGLLLAFIQMYNIVYDGYRDPISETATFNDLVSLDQLAVDYDTLKSANSSLATFVFDTMGNMEAFQSDDTTPFFYTYLPVKYYSGSDTSYYMILNLASGIKADCEEFTGTETELRDLIGTDLYDEIEQLMIDENMDTSSYVSNRLVDLREQHGFTLYDYYLGMDYQSVNAEYVNDTEGHESIVAIYDDVEITADELFYYAMNLNGALYTIYTAQLKELIENYFADVYCDPDEECQMDYSYNTSEKMEAHRADMETMKTEFESSYYSYYYSFEEYIYLAYGATSESDLLERYYVQSSLQPHMIYNELKSDDWYLLREYLYDRIDELYDNYFSLDVTHLLIYIDRDENGTPDDYDEFLATITDMVAYEAMLDRFTDQVYAYMEENTFSELVTTYAKAKHTDPVWGEFKDYGFYLMTEDLSSSASLTYASTKDTYDPQFVIGLQDAYQEFLLDEHDSDSTLLYDQPIATSFGTHIMLLERGDNFERPTGHFEMIYDNEGDPKYSEGIVNTGEELTLEQLELYSTYRFYEMAYDLDEEVLSGLGLEAPKIPTAVTTAIESYFTDIHDAIYVIGTLNIIVADNLVADDYLPVADSDFTFIASDLETMNGVIRDIYFKQVFGEDSAE